MRNTQKRIEQLERRINPPEPDEIFVYMCGEDGLMRRWNTAGEIIEVLTAEQFEQLPGEKFHVRPADQREE